jgi:hypothetical protein
MKVKYQYRNINLNDDFKCVHCRYHVSADSNLSGVINRNHCPYCLYSRHLDLHKAGDRLSACKGQMKPVGLTVKNSHKKYGDEKQGELMLIHLCAECHKVSINRIAADDLASNLYEIFASSQHLDAETRAHLEANQVNILVQADHYVVRARLFGCAETHPSFETIFA